MFCNTQKKMVVLPALAHEKSREKKGIRWGMFLIEGNNEVVRKTIRHLIYCPSYLITLLFTILI